MAAKKKKDDDETGIPPLVEDCMKQIRERGLREDGILRVSGSAAQIKDLQNAYRKGKRLDLSNVYIHTVGGVLKNYFRDMPKPILTFEAYEDFLACAEIENEEEKVHKLRFLVSQIPIENQELLHKTLLFIIEVSKYSEENQMHLANLATMFGPTFLRKKEQERAALLQDLQSVIAVTLTMLSYPMFENWPDNQDRHPSRVKSEVNAVKKVRQAVTQWYGSNDWEKVAKKRQSTRIGSRGTGLKASASSPSANQAKSDGDVGSMDEGEKEEGKGKGKEEEEEEEV